MPRDPAVKKELEEKFVGKKVIVTNINENPAYFVSPGMDPYRIKAFLVKLVAFSVSNDQYVLTPEETECGGFGHLLPSWVEIVEDKPEPSGCRCNIFVTGCVCGAFKAEMQNKGKTYNSFLKTWE